ncbi:hypothetical protein WME99_28785 [Sorangium sp. So ce136]|uniref:hypothetical protein n=1 Tax=Sorangium sp. So ce136 TaxID=3133284 RepID=UPI003F08C810
MMKRDEIHGAGRPGAQAATFAITPEVPFQPVPGAPPEPGREVPHHPEPPQPDRQVPHVVPPAPEKGPPGSPEVPTPPGQPRPEILVRRASEVGPGAAP